MINKFFLGLVLLPTALYKRMGVNTQHLRAILLVKLMMDDRRPSSMQQMKRQQNTKPIKWATLGTMVMMAIFGIFFIIPFFITEDAVTQFTIYFSFFVFMLASTLISEFTSVLIDVRDNYIILPKPVNDKTFLLSRLLHIVIHVSKLVLPMNLAGFITVGILKGWYGLALFFLLIPFATVFTIFLINAIYIFILRITTPEKFKSVISYFQIVFAVLIYGGYQIVPRLMDMTILQKFIIPEQSWYALAPPYWFAAAWQVLYSGGSWYLVFMAFLSFAFPIFSVWLIVKYFAPSFNQKLAMISGSEQSEQIVKTKTESTTGSIKKSTYSEKLAKLCTNEGAERMGFLFTWRMTARSRDFKMKTYPAIGYLLVYIVLIFLRNKKISLKNVLADENGVKLFVIMSIYIISFVMMQALQNIKISDKYKAAWIYFITPIHQPGAIISGAAKAIICKFYLPMAFFISTIAITLLGWKVIPNIILGMSTQVCICFITTYLTILEFPFARTENVKVKGGNFIKGLFSLLIPLIMGFLQYTVYEYSVAVIILAALSLIATWLVAGSVYNRDWKTVLSTYQED